MALEFGVFASSVWGPVGVTSLLEFGVMKGFEKALWDSYRYFPAFSGVP